MTSDELFSRGDKSPKRLATFVNVAGFIALLWGIVYPHPHAPFLALVAGLPWVAIALVGKSKGELRLEVSRKNDSHQRVAAAFALPGFVLGVRAALDYNLISYADAAWATLGIAAFLFLACFVADRSVGKDWQLFAWTLALSLAYGYGLAVQLNTTLDSSAGIHYKATVADKYTTHSRTGTRYKLGLQPWGPDEVSTNLDVDYRTYDTARPGDTVNLVLRSGALGLKWYYMRASQDASATPPN